MNKITEIISEEEFFAFVNSEKPTLVDFFASWCAPCKMQAPILREFAEDVGEKAVVIKVDVDQNPSLAAEYGVESIPTLAVFKDGELKEKTARLTAKATLSEMLIKYL